MIAKTEVLTPENFLEVCRTQLLVRVLETDLTRRRGVRVDAHVFWLSGLEHLFKLHYLWREPGDGSIDPIGEASKVPAIETLEVSPLSVKKESEYPDLINSLLRSWGESYPLAWSTTKPIVVCRRRWGASEELSPSDFYILEHFIRLHTQIAFSIQSGHPEAEALRIAGRRLLAMVRQQQELWARIVGLRDRVS